MQQLTFYLTSQVWKHAICNSDTSQICGVHCILYLPIERQTISVI